MEECLRLLEKHGIRYLLIGGQALRLEGLPRFSMDWDIYIPPRDLENIRRINELLRDELDVPLTPLGPHGEGFVQTYQTRWGILQFHLGGPGFPPFDEAEKRAVRRRTETGVEVWCMAAKDLIATKTAAGREVDLQDVEFLKIKYGL